MALEHPFSATRKIIETILPDTKFFCKLGTVHGYFKLALEEKSIKLIQQGRFRYLRALMGLNTSSDERCWQSDVKRGLPYVMKIVDDTIMWAKDKKELEERATTVLNRCKEHNLRISRQKLSIHFAGHIISDGGICPEVEKFKAVR